jgi:hypothetical protein
MLIHWKESAQKFMVLSSDELEILDFLKSFPGAYVPIVQVCRSASSRQRYKDAPNWANPLMSRLVEARMVEVNDRGHFRFVTGPDEPIGDRYTPENTTNEVVGDDYFPAASKSVGDDFFPATSKADEEEQHRWISPHIAEILKRSGKKIGGSTA